MSTTENDKNNTAIKGTWSSFITKYTCLLLAILILFVIFFHIYRWLRIYFLRNRIHKAVPKAFLTSFETENRYENIQYHCKLIKALLKINKDYAKYSNYLLSGPAFAYRQVLKECFISFFEYIIEIIRQDFNHYLGKKLAMKEIHKIKQKLAKSFVCRYYRRRTYDALDSFADYSDALINVFKEINGKLIATKNEKISFAAERMNNNIQDYYNKYKEFSKIRKYIFKHKDANNFTYYTSFGYSRKHFIVLLRHYVEFTEKHYGIMQQIYNQNYTLSCN